MILEFFTPKKKNMIKRLLLTSTILLSAVFMYAQTSLEGKISEEETGNVAELATIKLFKEGVFITGAQTDFDGFYSISPVDPGTYTVEASYVGFTTKRIEGVVVKQGKSNVVNVKLSKGIVINEVEIVAYKVPLIEQDNTTQGSVVTAEQIRNLPQRNINAIAASTAGVSASGENGAITIRGSRSNSTVYWLDGIPVSGSFVPVWDLEQLQVITGGLSAEYGDATGGIISGSTKGPSQKFAGGIEAETSAPFDGYGYNLINANLSGPILRKKGTKESILGFRVSGSYNGYKDGNPSAVGVYSASQAALDRIAADPITRLGPDFLVQTGELLRNNTGDVNLLKVRPNEASSRIDLNGKIDWRINSKIDVSFNVTSSTNSQKFAPTNGAGADSWLLLNSQNNPESLGSTSRFNFRFRHRLGNSNFSSAEDAKAQLSAFRNASYTLQFFYQNRTGETYDSRFKDNFFDYGYIGEFDFGYRGAIAQDQNGVYRQVDNTRYFIGYDPTNSKNPGLANYNKLIKDANSDLDYIQRNGSANNAYTSVWNFHTNINDIYNSYQKSRNENRTFSGTLGFDFVPGSSEKGKHNIQIGVFYEERTARSYSVAPRGLWTTAQLLQNQQIAGVDTSNIAEKNHQFTLPDGSIILADSFATKVDNIDGSFYKNIRTKLGVGLDHYVEVDKLDPSILSLNMFSSRELTDRGLASFYGYDYLGNELGSGVNFNDFWTKRDASGHQLFPVAAVKPIYAAGYIQDKFSYKDIIFRVGIRADLYDNNTKVLKDQYSLYDIITAKEFYDNNPNLTRPGVVGDDYKVYVSQKGSNAVKAYRVGEQWYFPNGTRANDGNIIFGGTIVNPKYKNALNDIRDPNFDPNNSFEDYKRQLNVMPRLAFSFPISDDANFFAHYDILVQRPTSNTIFTPLNYYYFEDASVRPSRINNPNLKPEQTIDYEVGFQQKLTNATAIKLSAYYKEMRNMIQARTLLYIPAPISTYDTYGNIDFGTVKGFSVGYDYRRTGNLMLNANYTLQFADGTGSDADSQAGVSSRGNIRTLFPLNFDERHSFNLNVDWRYENGKKYNGPKIQGIPILEDFGINIDARAISGRPYSRNLIPTVRGGSGYAGAINGARLPWRFFLNLKIDKNINLNTSENRKRDLYLNIYFRAQNILNLKTVVNVYPVTGSPDDSGYLVSQRGIQDLINVTTSGRDADAFADSYQWYVLNPDNYAPPRRLYIGALFQF